MTSRGRRVSSLKCYLNYKLGFFVLNIVLAVVLVFTVVEMVRAMVFRPTVAYDASASVPDVPEPVRLQPLSYYEPLMNSEIFGSSSETTVEPRRPAISLDSLPKTSLKLRLVGTVIDPETGSYAIVIDSSLNKADTYRPGDTITSEVELLEVYSRRVVILRDGQREVLEMRYEEGSASAKAVPRRTRRHSSVSSSPQVRELDRDLIRRDFDGLAQEVLNNVQVSQNKSFRGRRGLGIDNVAAGSPLGDYGIRSGDVLLSVNGQEVKSLADVMALLPQLEDADEVRVTVGRGSGFQTFTYRLR